MVETDEGLPSLMEFPTSECHSSANAINFFIAIAAFSKSESLIPV